MRHRKKFNHLSRKSAHRKAMLRNMTISLIEHKRIKTTVAKAKALRSFAEPIINRSKVDTTHSRRMVFKSLQNKDAVNTLFREIAQKITEREGGYTRILKIGNRLGDNADMCYIELVDYNENYFTEKSEGAKKKRTRRGSSGSGKTETSEKKTEKKEEAETITETKTEEVKDETAENKTDEDSQEENSEEKEDDKSKE